MRIVDGLSADLYTTKTAALGLRVHVIGIEAPRRIQTRALRAGSKPKKMPIPAATRRESEEGRR
jgi:hypothetical protein